MSNDIIKEEELIKLLNQKINFIEKYLHKTSYSEEDFNILLSYKQFDMCKQFRTDINCNGCPIQQYAGKTHCGNTQYIDLINIADQILQIQNNINEFDSGYIQCSKSSLLHELIPLENQFNRTLKDFYWFLILKIHLFIIGN